jgi:hypothetical protein
MSSGTSDAAPACALPHAWAHARLSAALPNVSRIESSGAAARRRVRRFPRRALPWEARPRRPSRAAGDHPGQRGSSDSLALLR